MNTFKVTIATHHVVLYLVIIIAGSVIYKQPYDLIKHDHHPLAFEYVKKQPIRYNIDDRKTWC